jgi:Tol biopolymer transport system component
MRNAVFTILAAVAAVGCGDSFMGPPPLTAEVTTTGRAERGLTVPVVLTSGGAPVNGAVFTVSPSTAADVLAGDSLQLNTAGPLTIAARGLAGHDSVHATLVLTVAVPPTVVFDNLDAGNRDIWSVQLDGGVLTRLTTDAGDDRQPTARMGTVVFISYRTGSAELFSVPLAGGGDAQLTTNAIAEADPALNASDTQLAFTQGSGFPRIMTAGANGAGATRLIAADGGWSGALEGSPAWSPTGDRVAYMTTRDGAAGIYIGAVSGASGSATQLVDGAHGYASVEPAWSPGGSSVAFASNRDGPTDLYLVTVATGAVRRLTTLGNVGQPAFTADGRLLFTRFAGGAMTLDWLDLMDTSAVHAIPTGTGSAQHPSEAR